ncbi:mannitol dehydrogenase family protein [Litoreibacter arenae]|uniref:Multiple polyol-specific dehydrogenase n=1 Tax=Litoreibacter arenae DSM 19593 TaxID=1123360 RepID=S9RGZ9_9RHOB|nr:mannitol dehydrogenase family protein [Litoreibacter arenae]EPX77370.1 Multiple polyol-specific dehydrogenase [Litoreibacter arenae DSM 19593]
MNKRNPQALYATGYDRAACDIGVVHLGFGAFHRAHQAMYIDDTMEATGDLRWGIAAVNLRAAEANSFAAHRKDGYIIKSISPDGQVTFRQVRSHVAFADWSKDASGAEALLSLASVHMVTITVTESGYYTDDAGALNPDDPVIKAEVAGGAPVSVYAYLAAALRGRMKHSGAPLTVLCCDNIRENGTKLGANFAAYMGLLGDADLANWVARNVTFPCSMVDRITPRSSPDLASEMQAIFGERGTFPVIAESFVQWVLEDKFAGPMPDLAAAGVTVTTDVHPYEEAKIRILNGGHTALTYLAALHGLKTFDAAMRDADLVAHFWAYERDEVLPALTLDLPFDRAEYLQSIADRFGNAAIADSVERICADGMAKFPIFIRPTLEGCLAQGITPDAGFRSVASWYVFAQHIAAGKLPLTYLEPSWDTLQPMLRDAAGLEAFCTSKLLWADLPDRFPDFAGALRGAIKEMELTWPV